MNFWSLGLTLPRRYQHLSDGDVGMQGFQYKMMSLPKKPIIQCVSPPVSGAPSHPLLNYKDETQVCPLHFLWRLLLFFTFRHKLVTQAWRRACGRKTLKKWRTGGCSILKMMTTQQLLLLVLLLWGIFFFLWCSAIKRIWNTGCGQKGEMCSSCTAKNKR